MPTFGKSVTVQAAPGTTTTTTQAPTTAAAQSASLPTTSGTTALLAGVVTVPDSERGGYIAWKGRYSGRWPTPGPDGKVTAQAIDLSAYRVARDRVAALLARDGAVAGPAASAERAALEALWREADPHGLAAFDRRVVAAATFQGNRGKALTFAPRAFKQWFDGAVHQEAEQLGINRDAARANIVAKGVPNTDKQRVFGFDLTAAQRSFASGGATTGGEPEPQVSVGRREIYSPTGRVPSTTPPATDMTIPPGAPAPDYVGYGIWGALGGVLGGVGAAVLKQDAKIGAGLGALLGLGAKYVTGRR